MPTKNTKEHGAGKPPKRSSKPIRNSPAKRKPGRPPQADRAVTPEVLEQIGDMFLAGWKTSQIARKIGVDWSTVDHHLKVTIQPVWEAKLGQKAGIELAKIDHLERLAWKKMMGDAPGEIQTEISRELLDGGSSLELVKKATRRIRRPGSTAWAMVIEWAIEQRCKLLGHYKTTDARTEEKDEFRVAGMSTDELDAKMMKMLLDKVEEKRREREAMRRNGYPG